MRVVNVGGSVTTALVLSALAWGIRLLRAKNSPGGREARPAPVAARAASRALFGRLSPAAFRLLLDAPPFPFLLVDVRSGEEAAQRPLSAWLGPPGSHPPPAVVASEADLPALLRPGRGAWAARFGSAPPGASATLLFLSPDGAAAQRAASLAAALGHLRCSVVEGGLDALLSPGGSALSRPQPLSRHALALLLQRGEGCVAVVDVRRCEERCLYGGVAGSVCLPAEQLPRALAGVADEWARTHRFPKPCGGEALVLVSRGERRARWAAQLVADAGVELALVLRDGTQGWGFDPGVLRYEPFEEGEVPPEPEPPGPACAPNVDAGEDELSRLGLL